MKMTQYQTQTPNTVVLVNVRESVARLAQGADGVAIQMLEFQPAYAALATERYASFDEAQAAVEGRFAEVGSIIGRRAIF